MATKKGIDVSVWNGTINWVKVKPQIDFAILRAGYGKLASQKDKQFDNNYNGCKQNKIPVGAYWYNYAKTVTDAQAEARACIEVLKGKNFDYPIWYDIEENSVFTTGKANVSKIAETFCEMLKAAGYKVGIYSSYYTFKTYFTDEVKNKYDIWLAHVGNNGAALSSTNYPGHKEMWQYSWKGRFDGINGDVDTDYCYKDYVATTTPVTPSVPTTPTTPTTPNTSTSIDVTYRAYTGKWWGEIKNYNETNSMGYAGVDNLPISGLAAKVSKGALKYRVHTKGGKWLGWISGYNINNWATGVAGIKGQVIDGIQMELTGVPGYKVQYRVSYVGTPNYLSWITNYGNGSMGYAGIYGKQIDKIQIRIVKA